jgi:hypothetical protein
VGRLLLRADLATLGIYVFIMFYRRLNRADLFRERRLHYYSAVIDATSQYARPGLSRRR